MSKSKVFEYPGKDIDVYWNGQLCIHVAECGRAKGDLFEGGRKPWCQPDLAANAEVEEVIKRCPTGALSYKYKDGSNSESPSDQNTVQVANNGPLYVKGALEIEGAPENADGLKFRAALCRCGQSKNKPFCDNSHEDAGFKDYGAIGETGQKLNEQGGPLKVTPVQDGPLIVEGNLTLKSGSGRDAWQGKKVALCRCGASQNKPFCDGSHVKAGFKS